MILNRYYAGIVTATTCSNNINNDNSNRTHLYGFIFILATWEKPAWNTKHCGNIDVVLFVCFSHSGISNGLQLQ